MMVPARSIRARISKSFPARALVGLGVLGALFGLGGCGPVEGAPGSVGQPAPAYAAPSMDGDTVALADFEGEVVLLNIWATWCAPCRVEMPHLQALHEELAEEGLRIVGVSVDSQRSRGAVTRFTGDLGIEFLILQDPGERISHLFNAYGIPFNALIDREGIIRWRQVGPVTADDPRLRAALEEALSASHGR
jgi:cytochrome c biogenesis protein CcmG, thiol:disulfide interchange protein DsbE